MVDMNDYRNLIAAHGKAIGQVAFLIQQNQEQAAQIEAAKAECERLLKLTATEARDDSPEAAVKRLES